MGDLPAIILSPLPSALPVISSPQSEFEDEGDEGEEEGEVVSPSLGGALPASPLPEEEYYSDDEGDEEEEAETPTPAGLTLPAETFTYEPVPIDVEQFAAAQPIQSISTQQGQLAPIQSIQSISTQQGQPAPIQSIPIASQRAAPPTIPIISQRAALPVQAVQPISVQAVQPLELPASSRTIAQAIEPGSIVPAKLVSEGKFSLETKRLMALHEQQKGKFPPPTAVRPGEVDMIGQIYFGAVAPFEPDAGRGVLMANLIYNEMMYGVTYAGSVQAQIDGFLARAKQLA